MKYSEIAFQFRYRLSESVSKHHSLRCPLQLPDWDQHFQRILTKDTFSLEEAHFFPDNEEREGLFPRLIVLGAQQPREEPLTVRGKPGESFWAEVSFCAYI